MLCQRHRIVGCGMEPPRRVTARERVQRATKSSKKYSFEPGDTRVKAKIREKISSFEPGRSLFDRLPPFFIFSGPVPSPGMRN